MAKASAAPATIAIVCGLGNPDADYERTRHNAGFATVDVLAARHGVRYWKSEAGAQVASLTWRGADGEQREVLLAKPMSYMNTSGGPLSKLARAHRVAPQQILVVHDEVDLASSWAGASTPTTACAPLPTSWAAATLPVCSLALAARPERCRWRTMSCASSRVASSTSSTSRRNAPPTSWSSSSRRAPSRRVFGER